MVLSNTNQTYQFVFIQELPVKRDLLPPYVFNLCRNISYEKSGGNSGIVVIQVEHKMSQFQDVSIGAGTAYSTTADEISPAFSGVRISRSLRVSGIDCASFYEFPCGFCKCSDSLVYLVFHFNTNFPNSKCPQYNSSMLACSYKNISTLCKGH